MKCLLHTNILKELFSSSYAVPSNWSLRYHIDVNAEQFVGTLSILKECDHEISKKLPYTLWYGEVLLPSEIISLLAKAFVLSSETTNLYPKTVGLLTEAIALPAGALPTNTM